ncbi:MAG: ribosome biogenesis GTPase Der, partial [Candidatus Binataceae bacterium]|nr:ribosome biogenesis GTPase Der [Candidatus Binataceae bacterium]
LFNRLAGANRAIVSAVAGTTRDLNVARVNHDGHTFILADSGGLELGGHEALTEAVVERALGAAAASAVVLFLLDGRAGLTAADREAFTLVRSSGRPIVVAVNKIDQPRQEGSAAEFYSLTEELFPISAAHGLGIGELLDAVTRTLPEVEQSGPQAQPDLRVALIGRPNVGKSSILNCLVGFDRSIVGEAPGTTRDPVDVPLTIDGHNLILIDTAGIRRRTRITGELEHRSVGHAIGTIKRAGVLILVIDATEGITDQDARLARMVATNGRGLVLVCNKWDAAAQQGARIAAFTRDAQANFPFLAYAPMLFTSALTGDRINHILPAALDAGRSWRAVLQTANLNRVLADALAALDPPLVDGRRLKIMYVTQVASAPPKLAFFCNIERNIPAHYMRFLESRFRAALALVGTPLLMEFRRATGSRPAPRPASGRRAGERGAHSKA